MWRYKNFLAIAAAAVILGAVFGVRPSKDLSKGQFRGELDAQKDLASGHYIQLGYGLPLPWASEFDLCLQGYGIEVRNIGGDVFEDGHDLATGIELSYYESYNEVSSVAIKKKFGPDVFDRCTETARHKWESSHPESKRKSPP